MGFSRTLDQASSSTVHGFAAIDVSEGTSRATVLPYPEGEKGLALEHAALTVPLLEETEALSGVTVLRRTRVTSIDRNDADGVQITVTSPEGPRTIRARLLVAADGRGSAMRKLLGIEEDHHRLSTMVGVKVDVSALPHPGHGHLFVGGKRLLLAYATDSRMARVMVDLPLGSRPSILRERPELLDGIPAALRSEILAAMDREAPLAASNDTRLPEAVVRGSAVLVGDAAGCCHPLSASGLSSAVRDARFLQQSLQREPDDIARALDLYVRDRRPAQRTRIALASALYDGLAGTGPEMAALRRGLFGYWNRSIGGARVSMSLLSSRESRMWVMAREYARVVVRGAASLAIEAARPEGRDVAVLATAMKDLVASAGPHLDAAIKGTGEDLGAAMHRLRSALIAPAGASGLRLRRDRRA